MSDYGEKTCPLCAEEMDLTDQQLNPCKCGYQVYPSSLFYMSMHALLCTTDCDSNFFIPLL